MSKKLLILIIFLMSTSLSGIIIVQLYWSNSVIKQNEEKFDRKINEILRSVIKKTEKNETAFFIKDVIGNNNNRNNYFSQNIDISFDNKLTDSIILVGIDDSLVHELIVLNENNENEFHWDMKSSEQYFEISNTDEVNGELKTVTRIVGDNDHVKTYSNSYIYKDGKEYRDNRVTVKKRQLKKKTKKINNVLKKMVYEYDLDYNAKRLEVKYNLIDSILKYELLENEIFIPYEYAISSGMYSKKYAKHSKEFSTQADYKKYSISLFPDDLVPKNDELMIYFPKRKTHIFKSLSIMFSASAFFIIIILFAFSISIYMIIKQKKISDIKTDFINNMTHEFKTPIATISLAADSVVNPKVIKNVPRIESFIKIIKNENKRMNLQVEKILQMSLLEKSDLDLNIESIDIHKLLKTAINNIGIQIEEKKGIIISELHAKDYNINADAMHFSNIINNLLDNAIKYSKIEPNITITTKNVNKGILISIKDKGIGMSKDEISKIFEKFYRVSKGNIHNTKGFGLGLSYVKAIVEEFNGKISVISELNIGSVFNLHFPIE